MNNKTPEEFMRMYLVTEEDLALLSSIKPHMEKSILGIITHFYDWLQTQPEFEEFFHDTETFEHARKQQTTYALQLFNGKIDNDYLEYRAQIGAIHARIGLPQDIYIASVEKFSSLFLDVIDNLKIDPLEKIKLRSILLKILHIDMTAILQSYEEVVNLKIAAQSKTLLEMSTPVTQLWEGLLLLPVVGIIDTQRAQNIMNNTLIKISETHAKGFILDISGVAVVDTSVANHLIKITKATKLMGCESIISGVSPSIAQTIVELGIDVGTMKTTSDMNAALELSFSYLGMEIKKDK